MSTKFERIATLGDELGRVSVMARAVFQALPMAVLIVSRDGQIIEAANDRMLEFGYTPRELIGQSMRNLVPDDKLAIHDRGVEEYWKNPTVRRMAGRRLSIKHALGHAVPAYIALAPIFEDHAVSVVVVIEPAGDSSA